MLPHVAGKTARPLCAPPPSLQLAQRSDRRPDFGTEEFRLFPRREVPTLVDLVEALGIDP
jgi:hypothetical protein